MFGKVATVAFFVILVAPGEAAKDLWSELTTKWNFPVSDPLRFNSYFSLPLTYGKALKNEWTRLEGALDWIDVIAVGYKGDPRYEVLFNSTTGLVMGFQVAFLIEDVAHLSHQIKYEEIHGISEKIINGQHYWAAAIYYFKNEGGTHQAYYEDRFKIVEIPINTEALKKQELYLPKTCFDGRGTYYSQIDSTTTSATLFPWNLIFEDGGLVGFWFTAIGSPKGVSSRNWYDGFSAEDLENAIPDASKSLIDDSRRYGLISSHTWLSENPWTIVCQKIQDS